MIFEVLETPEVFISKSHQIVFVKPPLRRDEYLAKINEYHGFQQEFLLAF